MLTIGMQILTMTPAAPLPTSDDSPSDLLQAIRQQQRLVVVVDLMESVRLMQQNEQATLTRWLGFVQYVQTELLPKYPAQLVKSTGDGLLLQLDDPRVLDSFTQRMHAHFAQINTQLAPEQTMWLRIGCHLTDVFAAEQDIYGAGVNLACRIATLANPGETVVSAEVRDLLVDGLDAAFTDMGECYLKHIDLPKRCYKLRSPQKSKPTDLLFLKPLPADAGEQVQVLPAIAVIPFESRTSDIQTLAIGDLIADGVIAQLSRSPQLRVLSRLSTQAMRGRAMTVSEVATQLRADYLLMGSQVLLGEQLWVQTELVCVAEDRVVWSDRIKGVLPDLFERESQLCQALAHGAHQALLDLAAQKALTKPLPNLQSYALFLGGVQLMHRSRKEDFFRSKALLDALRERHPRSASMCAWSSKWFVLCVTRGLSSDIAKFTPVAMDLTKRALDLEGNNSLALAMQGFVALHLLKDISQALQALNASIALNPNEPLGNLFHGVAHAFIGNGAQALQSSLLALHLSPVDPLMYYYKSLMVSSAIAADEFDLAIRWGYESLQGNKYHLSTYRALITALVERNQSGDVEEALKVKAGLLDLHPTFTVGQYLKSSPSTPYPFGQRVARALLATGIPL